MQRTSMDMYDVEFQENMKTKYGCNDSSSHLFSFGLPVLCTVLLSHAKLLLRHFTYSFSLAGLINGSAILIETQSTIEVILHTSVIKGKYCNSKKNCHSNFNYNQSFSANGEERTKYLTSKLLSKCALVFVNFIQLSVQYACEIWVIKCWT